MLRVAAVLLLVTMIFVFGTVASISFGPDTGAPSAVSTALDGFAQDAFACLSGCRKP